MRYQLDKLSFGYAAADAEAEAAAAAAEAPATTHDYAAGPPLQVDGAHWRGGELRRPLVDGGAPTSRPRLVGGRHTAVKYQTGLGATR